VRVGDTIKIDPAVVGAMAQKLKGLAEEFKESDHDEYFEGIEPGSVKGKLHDFAHNWSEKKKSLEELLEDLSGFAKQAADTHGALDTQIATAIDKMESQVKDNVSASDKAQDAPKSPAGGRKAE
jgi:hypothetical protein